MRWSRGKSGLPSADFVRFTSSGMEVDLERYLRTTPAGRALLRDFGSRREGQGEARTVNPSTTALRARPDQGDTLPLIVAAAVADSDSTCSGSSNADSAGSD